MVDIVWIPTRVAAERLGISASRVHKLVNAGLLTSRYAPLTGVLLLDGDQVDAYAVEAKQHQKKRADYAGWLTPTQVAKRLGVSTPLVYYWLKVGAIASERLHYRRFAHDQRGHMLHYVDPAVVEAFRTTQRGQRTHGPSSVG